MDSNKNNQQGNIKEVPMAQKNGSDDEDGKDLYTVTNPSKLLSFINPAYIKENETDPHLIALRENYKQRKELIQNLFDELVKNEGATCDYWDQCKELYTYHDRNYKNENADYRNNNNLAGLIRELKTNLTHLTKVIPKIMCFKAHLMHTLESLESSLKNVCEVETEPDLTLKERSIELVVVMPNSLSNYERRKEAIEILDNELTKMDKAVLEYIDDYGDFTDFGDKNKEDFYSSNENLVEFIIEMKELDTPVINVLGRLNAYKAHLLKCIEILEKNLKDMEEREAQE